MSSSSSSDLSIIFLPFLSPGHMIPLVDLAKAMSRHHGVRAIIVTTTGNAHLIQPSIAGSEDGMIALHTLPFPSSVPDSTTKYPTPDPDPEFLAGLDRLQGPVEQLLKDHGIHPDCIIADVYFAWVTDLAAKLGIPRLAFHAVGCFPTLLFQIVSTEMSKPGYNPEEPLTVPGIPHRVTLTPSQRQLPDSFSPGKAKKDIERYFAKMADALLRSYGTVTNTFYELEPDYVDKYRTIPGAHKLWSVGPLFLWDSASASADRGGESDQHCLSWLDNKKPDSVVYVAFGSLGKFTAAQLREMAMGLEACEHPFIWVIRSDVDESEWMPEGLEERVVASGKGLIIRGWVPQVLVLNHRSVGGFVTHCGWGSMMEGLAAGLPLITWPLFIDHFFTERLLVDLLGVGVATGSMVSSFSTEDRTLVSADRLRTVVNEAMGGWEGAEERRRRVKKLAAVAKGAVEEGGSSYENMVKLIQELVDFKAAKTTKSD